ncbi:MAG: DNA primase [Anaerolineae bacterium]
MQIIEEIKDRIDIVDFISSYVSLKKAGRTYKGLCPFHTEKTPSFVVFPHTQTWHCFGACGIGGDIFSFLMRREGLDFSEALRRLAERAGVALELAGPRSEAGEQKRSRLIEMHMLAAQYYHHLLRRSSEAEGARNYLAQRKINLDTAERFQLGYALNTWEGLKSFLLERGYSEQELIEGGLIVKKEESESTYDRFRNRLMIPIRNIRGQVIAFGARALNPNDVPKYLNSPQTLLFDKGHTLFGIDVAAPAIRQTDQAVLVEGYMDVLSAHQAGYSNVVAGMGTAFTEAQLQQLKRLTRRLVLALDADAAGSAATLRGIETARGALESDSQPVFTSHGLIRFERHLDVDIRIAVLPEGRDPDDILRDSPEEWPHIISKALPVVSFVMRALAAQADLSTAREKTRLVRQVLPLIREVGNEVERDHYISELAQLVKVNERALLSELQHLSISPTRTRAVVASRATEEDGEKSDFGVEEHLLALVMYHPAALAGANEQLAALGFKGLLPGDFQRSENQTLFLHLSHWALQQTLMEGTLDRLGESLERLDRILYQHFSFIREQGARLGIVPSRLASEEMVKGTLRLRIRQVQTEIANLRLLLDEMPIEGTHEEQRVYSRLVETTKQRLQVLERAYDRCTLIGRRREETVRLGS